MKAIIIQDDETKTYSRKFFRDIVRILMIEAYEDGLNKRYYNKEREDGLKELREHCNKRIDAVFDMAEI